MLVRPTSGRAALALAATVALATLPSAASGRPSLGSPRALPPQGARVPWTLPTFAWTCPLAQRVKERRRAKFDYLPTFQGEEIFAHFVIRVLDLTKRSDSLKFGEGHEQQ